MSKTAYGLSKSIRRLCRSCAERKALFRYRGVVKADRDHTLCFECFRSERERRRAQRLAEVPAARPLPYPDGPARTLTTRELEHRHRMLVHLRATREA
jgi:hypothetical protein